jgi:hypothetical protein
MGGKFSSKDQGVNFAIGCLRILERQVKPSGIKLKPGVG